MVSSFDPAAHLHKQGWKGKGTALKQGHATRPLAVVQKKNLGGIGRDRDEAVPFWDQIFAATAASIFSPTPSASGSGASTPLPSHTAHSSTRSWTTTTFDNPGTSNSNLLVVRPKEKGVPSTQARVGKEMARRGLYSRFMRGKTIIVEPEEDEGEVPVAGPSTLLSTPTDMEVPAVTATEVVSGMDRKGKRKEREGETKEEKKARKAAKAIKKAEKEAKRARKSKANTGTTEDVGSESGGKTKKKRKDKTVDTTDATISTPTTTSTSEKKEKKRNSAQGDTPAVDPSTTESKKEKKRRLKVGGDEETGEKMAIVLEDDSSKSKSKKRKDTT